MDTREGRIVVLGMVAGAALGGLAVFIMRMRGTRAEQESVRQAVSNLSWSEIFSIAVAAIALARRVAALSEPVAEAAIKE